MADGRHLKNRKTGILLFLKDLSVLNPFLEYEKLLYLKRFDQSIFTMLPIH